MFLGVTLEIWLTLDSKSLINFNGLHLVFNFQMCQLCQQDPNGNNQISDVQLS